MERSVIGQAALLQQASYDRLVEQRVGRGAPPTVVVRSAKVAGVAEIGIGAWAVGVIRDVDASYLREAEQVEFSLCRLVRSPGGGNRPAGYAVTDRTATSGPRSGVAARLAKRHLLLTSSEIAEGVVHWGLVADAATTVRLTPWRQEVLVQAAENGCFLFFIPGKNLSASAPVLAEALDSEGRLVGRQSFPPPPWCYLRPLLPRRMYLPLYLWLAVNVPLTLPLGGRPGGKRA